MSFQDKIVWITGASSGIGEYLAYAFAKEGAQLILSSRKIPELERVKNNCADPSKVHIRQMDLAVHQSLPDIAKQVLQQFKRVDVLINNGGISQRALVKDTSVDVDKKIMDINYFGTVVLTKAVLPNMVKNNNGRIVVMSSLMGKFSTPLRSAYAASKHALHGFFDALRAELTETNIKVTMICPGSIHTKISMNALTGDGSQQNKMDPRTEGGLAPETFSRKALKAIRKGKREVYIGKTELFGIYVSRYFPNLFAWLISRMKVT